MMEGKRSHAHRSALPVAEARRYCSKGRLVLETDEDVLRAAQSLLGLRSFIVYEDDEDKLEDSDNLERTFTRLLHRALRSGSARPYLAKELRRARLNMVEREIVLALALSATGMIDRANDVDCILDRIGRSDGRGIAAVRALRPSSRLAWIFALTNSTPI